MKVSFSGKLLYSIDGQFRKFLDLFLSLIGSHLIYSGR